MTDRLHESALTAIHDDPQGASWEPEVHDHVGRCPACQKTMKALRSFVTSMRRRTTTEQAPPELVAQVCRTVRAEETRGARRRMKILQLAVPVALAAGLALGAFLPRTTGAPESFLPDVTDLMDDVLHDRFLMADLRSTIEFSTDNPATAGAWLSSNLGFDVPLDPAPVGWTLRGARVWHTVGSLSGVAVFARDGEIVMVFARPLAGIDVPPMPADAPEGATRSWRLEAWDHAGVAWLDGSLAFVAVGSSSVEDVAGWVQAYLER